MSLWAPSSDVSPTFIQVQPIYMCTYPILRLQIVPLQLVVLLAGNKLQAWYWIKAFVWFGDCCFLQLAKYFKFGLSLAGFGGFFTVFLISPCSRKRTSFVSYSLLLV